jgi:hypothetical protein
VREDATLDASRAGSEFLLLSWRVVIAAELSMQIIKFRGVKSEASRYRRPSWIACNSA